MKKILFIIGIFLQHHALYAETTSIYYGIGIGKNSYSKLPNYTEGTSILFNAEKAIKSLQSGEISINTELSHTIEPIKLDPDIAFHEITITTLGIYANYRHNFTTNFYAKVKLGLLDVDYQWDYGTGHTHDRDENSLHFSQGIGLGYQISSKLRLNIEYIFCDGSDLKALNLSVQKSF